jgi:hypothetical protein
MEAASLWQANVPCNWTVSRRRAAAELPRVGRLIRADSGRSRGHHRTGVRAFSVTQLRIRNGSSCPLAVIRALAACTFKTRALTDFALFNHLIRAGAAVAGYAGPEAADFPVKLVLGYIGID